ncbi:DUF1523 family protein [Campylobacter gastrosuis]|uniref:DUF1523 family protein n=1 Tax=Campylobacter gastrosuis TaxID=2974576 RepID=A0ABT7HMT2_9BACT|nr:DUF1523 family protein [Campylobacter gastrosuis]MDL0088226.1 DUF1523 family protein [Campylobacter gastrosuis]
MKKIVKNALFVLVFVLHALLAFFINYSMPSYKALNIVGAEVKRVDEKGVISDELPKDKIVRDIYFIYAKKPNSDDKIVVFRNEDTRWGYPFYFKFNSADIQAKATAFLQENALVQVKYYGYRVQILNEFANVISLKKLQNQSDLAVPYVSFGLYILVFISFLTLFFQVKKRF